jgi:hypothetical protein
MFKQLKLVISAAVTATLVACGGGSEADGAKKLAADGDVMDVLDSGTVVYKANAKLCDKLSGMNQYYAEGIAQKYSVSVSSISLIRGKASSDKSACHAVVDTPSGPKECLVGSIVKVKSGDYIAATYRKHDDGNVFRMSGMCLD